MLEELRKKLEKQGYHILGKRGAFKACQWQRKSLLSGDVCYKERFYGIESHRCLQMTPVVDKCTQNCSFCWRVTPRDLGIHWDQVRLLQGDADSASNLMKAALMANIRSLGGYNPEAGADVAMTKYLEARNPRHVAISLAGEPTLYPLISDLIEEINRRDMTSFLVTNGTQPKTIQDMIQPTQLYITLAAPNEEIHRRLCQPGIKHSWQNLLESQEVLHSLSCRTVNRLTMVKDENMQDPRAYSALILKGEPDFIEVKGYMFLGSSRGRLGVENAPAHREIRSFSKKLSDLTGYYLLDEQSESRVVLLSKNKHVKKLGPRWG